MQGTACGSVACCLYTVDVYTNISASEQNKMYFCIGTYTVLLYYIDPYTHNDLHAYLKKGQGVAQ